MGISRDSRHKRRLTGGRRNIHQKKRKGELGRPAANTKLDLEKGRAVHVVRGRGGNLKYRALRLVEGNFSWASENVTAKTRIQDVVYNASNNELVRTKTLVKNAVVEVDATPFRLWFEKKYATQVGKKTGKEEPVAETKKSKHVLAKLKGRQENLSLDPLLKERFLSGRLLASISSRPGQVGRADGYLLEGKELDFYTRKLAAKKKA